MRSRGLVYMFYCGVVYEWWKYDEEGMKEEPGAGIILFLSKNIKGTAMFNLPIRRTNHCQ